MDRSRRRALTLAATLGVPGVLHFVTPKFFDAVVPKWMPGPARTVTYVSGVAELTGAALVLNPSTRRFGGWWCLAVFLAVYPANIQMALDGGVEGAPSPMGSAAAAWARLPFQFPMFWLAHRVAVGAD